MLTYDEALIIAKALKSEIDFCVEYSDAYMFGLRAEDNIIGGNACIILKDSGKSVNMVDYYDLYEAEEIREFDV